MRSFTASIRKEAERLGFFKIGIVPSGPLPWRKNYDDWLRRGMQGKMAYMERQAAKRKDPALVLEHAETILILAMNYQTSEEPWPSRKTQTYQALSPQQKSAEDCSLNPLRGIISRYALGEDYHRIVGDRLGKLEEWILRERPGARCAGFVDAGPVMEKVWGAHSALGWMGKHTNLITREQGSWFFIGVLLLDIELEYDRKEKDYCGTCTRCISCCPTGAIVSPYVVDARLCISYLTIELRGPIPRRLRPLIGNRIFGCDDCQEVCPWNRFAEATTEVQFRPRRGNFMPELADLAGISVEGFKKRFAGSPIQRCGRNGLVRNVAVVLGNSNRLEAVPILERVICDPDPVVRGHAAWALGRIRGQRAAEILRSAEIREENLTVLDEIRKGQAATFQS